jgi:4-hydroxybenzoate polyprenyltransferase
MPARDLTTPDASPGSWVDALPVRARPYARLARFDRSVGTWLLFWPCGWGLALADGLPAHWPLLLWFAAGAFAMRGAGCVYNDIVDRDLDAQVERTRSRPLASGAVSVRAAWAWLVVLALIGLVVLLQLRWQAQLVALASLALVAAYPFMKRITWWPQAWLGLTFNWGALVGWIAVADPAPALAWLYAAGIFWTLGYDTIYALQDIEDDAFAGIKSSARALGDRARGGVGLFYALAIGCAGAAFWTQRPDPLVLAALLPAAGQLTLQVVRLTDRSPDRALGLFRSNRTVGLLLFAACLVVGWGG